MRVHEVGAASGPPDRPGHGGEQRRDGPRLAHRVLRQPRTVGEPEVPVRPRRDHVHLDAARADPLGQVGDEATGVVPLVARVRGREEDDPHRSGTRARRQSR